MKIKYLVTGCVALSLSWSASATIIDHGSYLTDTESGLDWLKLTATNGVSYNAISTAISQEIDFIGWHYAHSTELRDLVSHATNTTGTWYFIPENGAIQSFHSLVTMFGITESGVISSNGDILSYQYVTGILADQGARADAGKHAIDRLIWNSLNGNESGSIDSAGYVWPQYDSEHVGSFLIRQTALNPEGSFANPILPVANLPVGWQFEFPANDSITYIDPQVATEYDYILDSGPNFRSVLLPDVGDGEFALYLWNGVDWIFDSTLTAGIEHSLVIKEWIDFGLPA